MSPCSFWLYLSNKHKYIIIIIVTSVYNKRYYCGSTQYVTMCGGSRNEIDKHEFN